MTFLLVTLVGLWLLMVVVVGVCSHQQQQQKLLLANQLLAESLFTKDPRGVCNASPLLSR